MRLLFVFLAGALLLACVLLVAAATGLYPTTKQKSGQATPAASAVELPPSPTSGEESAARQNTDPRVTRDTLLAPREAPPAPVFSEGTWINSEPLTVERLRGRVVLVDFWTYGCYNCRNTLPALKRFHETYGERGLTIVGVHSPEFDREKEIENVRRQVSALGIRYAVVTDNDFRTWNAYRVEAWPTVLILDKQGRIRYAHIGEGRYEEQEEVIRKLLAEESAPPATKTASDVSHSGEKRGVIMTVNKTDEEWRRELTPEQYRVLRQKGTERAFTGELYENHEKGVYLCAACGNQLFNSDAKYDSGSGWPSFWQPMSEEKVKTEEDDSLGVSRTEVVCARCGSHLGHVFDDGPRPTNLRYCINSVALKFDKQP